MIMSFFLVKAFGLSLETKGDGGIIGYPLPRKNGHLMDILLRYKQEVSTIQARFFKLHAGALFAALAQRILGGGAEPA